MTADVGNLKGKFNVPYGCRIGEFNYDRLEGIRDKLQIAEIVERDFNACREYIHEGDLVFLDPPYAVSSKSWDNDMFIAYNPTLFSLENQQRLADFIDYINEVQAYFILTNVYHPEIAKIFQGKGESPHWEDIGPVTLFEKQMEDYDEEVNDENEDN